jgi:hypothetical protein
MRSWGLLLVVPVAIYQHRLSRTTGVIEDLLREDLRRRLWAP